nr:hypothetical protein BaRGS_020405 [Batillaria attramentaria]
MRARNNRLEEVLAEVGGKVGVTADMVAEVAEARRLLSILQRMNIVRTTLQDWSAVQALLGRGARANFTFIKKLVGLDAAFVDVAHVRRAQKMLQRYSLDAERRSPVHF